MKLRSKTNQIKGSLKSFARKSKTSIIAYKVWDNWRMRRRFRAGDIETKHGSTHKGMTTAESLNYIDAQFRDYLKYSGLHENQLRGKRVLELGSGDNVGLALRFLAAGAVRVVCLDKFYSQRNPDQQIEIYRALRATLPAEQRASFDQAINLENGLEINPDKLRCIYGLGLEESANFMRDEQPFELIISRAVIEEIYDPDPLFKATDRLLAPGGYILHKIDLSDYGMFSGAEMHPLTFLTIPEWLYRLMARDSGLPNRRLIDYYRNLMTRLGYDAKLFIASIISVGDLKPHKERIELDVDYSTAELALIEAIRSKLIRPYAKLDARDLLVSGIFLVGTKAALPVSPRPLASFAENLVA